MPTDKVNLKVAEISYDSKKSIVIIEYREHETVTKEDAEQIISTVERMAGGKIYASISILKDNPISKPAQRILSHFPPKIIAVALIVENEILQSIIDLFINTYTVKFKIRIFSDKDSAYHWLENELSEHINKDDKHLHAN